MQLMQPAKCQPFSKFIEHYSVQEVTHTKNLSNNVFSIFSAATKLKPFEKVVVYELELDTFELGITETQINEIENTIAGFCTFSQSAKLGVNSLRLHEFSLISNWERF